MKFRRPNLRTALICLSRLGAALLLACATVFGAAGTLAASSLLTQSEQNEQRSEIDGSEHFRATLHPTRRSLRSKPNPVCGGGVVFEHLAPSAEQLRSPAAHLRSTPSVDVWTCPKRL